MARSKPTPTYEATTIHDPQLRAAVGRNAAFRRQERGHSCPMPLGFPPMPFGYSLRGHCRNGTTERPVVRQSQRDCVLQPRVAESARLPWVSVRAIFNPNGVVSPLRQRALSLGLGDTTRFSQGSSRLAILGFGSESLWDSALTIPQSIGSIPSGIGHSCPLRGGLSSGSGQECPRSNYPGWWFWRNLSCASTIGRSHRGLDIEASNPQD